MKPFFYDLETFWSVEHSLTKMNPILYCLHRETELQSMAYAMGNDEVEVVFGEDEIRYVLKHADVEHSMAVAHNGSGFDHLILAWRLGIRPAAWGCTLAMARPIYGITVGGSLKKVSQAMGLDKKFGGKGDLEEVNTKGKKLKDFTPDEIARMRVYNKQDTVLCRGIFEELAPQLGKHELKLIDMTIDMTVYPQFYADQVMLRNALDTEIERKKLALLKLASLCGVYQEQMTTDEAAEAMRAIVMSQPQFAGLLTQLGATVPMKENAKGLMIPALAKTDKGLESLLEYDESEDEDTNLCVQVAAATRMEIKSTQLETRLKTYLDVSTALGGMMPMPVNYCGAYISWRMSGGMKMNVQNNPRIDPSTPKPGDALRNSIIAPEGRAVVVADSSNIELRVAHALAGQHDTVAKLVNGEDLYCWFASTLFGRVITKADKDERFIGKVAMLSLQYGASWSAFQNMARVLSKGKTLLSEDECKRIVLVWRSMFGAIANKKSGIWKRCENAIEGMFTGNITMIDDMQLCYAVSGKIITPNGHWLQYPNLRKVMGKTGYDEWKYGDGQNTSRIYGAHLFENLCQHIARLIVMEQTLALHKHFPVALTAHDEAVCVPWKEEAEECKALALSCFSKAPAWWPTLPLAAEAGIGSTYGEAKH